MASITNAIEVDIGQRLPVAFAGLRRIVRALEPCCPNAIASLRADCAPEWNRLFPEARVPGLDLLAIADAPNQRRVFRESEQTYRVLNAVARTLNRALAALGRPLVLRNAGACDVVSLRGLMHAVECARLTGTRGRLVLCEWSATHAVAAGAFASARKAQLARMVDRMRAQIVDGEPGSAAAIPNMDAAASVREHRYLVGMLDPDAGAADRIAMAMLAVRDCFYSTNYEGATLAVSTARSLLDRGGATPGALMRAWDANDDRELDIPMMELDRADLGDLVHLRAQLHVHDGVICAFTHRLDDSLAAFTHGLDVPGLAPEEVADLHLYRAAAMTKRMGRIADARAEIGAGLAAIADRPSASLQAAWLRNLAALTHFQERDLAGARREEELALAAVDQVPGPSATHLKTNLISNFSVLAEIGGEFDRAIQIWKIFEPLNAKLASANADKVHAFRLGTLRYLAGDADAALASFELAFGKAVETGDDYNAEAIAAALGRVHLALGDHERAADWYGDARSCALRAGDCLHAARASAGLALARGDAQFDEARAYLDCNTTHPLAGQPLPSAISAGDPSAVLAALPLPKSKLMRPFDVVNV